MDVSRTNSGFQPWSYAVLGSEQSLSLRSSCVLPHPLEGKQVEKLLAQRLTATMPCLYIKAHLLVQDLYVDFLIGV